MLENQLINQKEENRNLKNENVELKKKLEEKIITNSNNSNFINENESDEFPAFYRRSNLKKNN